ncbi:hypothetical protein H257_13314 [Aphanomyces astaci]|uniref:Uncharacterized protein n=1 Tax=Aphanomyces astaci TaxID=112090 RepID=W4FWV9_APHAT|nr:hypothetical protein H257_13314 [Aphanomyces astaci]ETV71431.1 hypothetical protein H257_13314 [Aphanomyces astaci]|eukprot:XP_009839096.1 hypothetical protein H257_13314 [Aphanomyces astaci]
MSDQVFLDNCFTQYLDTIYLQEVTDSTNAIIDKVLAEAGDEGILEIAVDRWLRLQASSKDLLLMALAVLKH